jgi:hypothetical protein
LCGSSALEIFAMCGKSAPFEAICCGMDRPSFEAICCGVDRPPLRLFVGVDRPLEAPVVMARPCCLLAGVDRPLEGLVVMAQPLRLLPVVVRPSYQPMFVASCC